jgi:glycosyltransferase involved in cell wall biosynthesis
VNDQPTLPVVNQREGTPRVSICIPTFNRAGFIRRTLESALSQDDPDLEVVVLDDASTDGTYEIAASYVDPRLRVERDGRRYGPGGNFNRSLDLARGEYVKILCDDDFLYPGAVSRLADALDRFPEATLATSAWNLLDAPRSRTRRMSLLKNAPEEGTLVDLRSVVRSSWLWRNRIGSPSSVMLRKAALAGLRFNPEYHQMMDWDLWLQLLNRGPLVYLPQVLSAYQWHAETLSVKHQPLAQTAIDLLKISRGLARSLPTFGGAISMWDVKRLQALCSLNALEVSVKNAWRRRWRIAGTNLRLAIRALGVFLTAR